MKKEIEDITEEKCPFCQHTLELIDWDDKPICFFRKDPEIQIEFNYHCNNCHNFFNYRRIYKFSHSKLHDIEKE